MFALAAMPAAGAQGRGLSVAKPRADQLIAGHGRVTVVLRTAPRLRKLAVKLGDKGVRKAFRQVRPGVWRAALSRGAMRRGANVIAASSVDRAGRRDFVSARFYLGLRRRGYLTVKTRRRVASSAVARIRMRRLPDLRFHARLNGRNVSGLFRRDFLRRRVAYLGANDGLRFGRNRLKVFAARRDGSFDVERRTIFVRRNRPLAVAGPDRLIAGGRPVVLDGRRSRPSLPPSPPGAARASRGFQYRWSVLRRPRGSKARPARPAGARTRFRPDLVGTYRLRLTATDPSGARGSDVVTVTAAENAPPIGIPVETIHSEPEGEGGLEYSIRVGSETFPLNRSGPGTNKIQAVFLDRETLELLDWTDYQGTAADAESLKEEIENEGNQALVIVSNPADPQVDNQVSPAFAEVVKMLGAETIPRLEKPYGSRTTEPGWSVIGVPGSGNGATVGAGTNERDGECLGGCGNLRGYLARDGRGQFTYVSGSVTPFDTSASGGPTDLNRIEVGGTGYESTPLLCAGADGAFQVLILFSETLEELANETFTTNGCNAESEASEAERMTKLLDDFAVNFPTGPVLVFVQGMGTPRPAAELAAWAPLEEAMARVGATRRVFAEARQSYSLVGAAGIAGLPLTEASQSLTGSPAHISGLLQTNQLGSYVPLAASPTGSLPFDLAEIAYQPAQAWPYSETAGEKAALTYVTELLGLKTPKVGYSCYVPPQPDVRSEYCNPKHEGEWIGFANQLREAKCGRRCRHKHGFSSTDWENVKAELAGRDKPGEFFEFIAVEETWNLVKQLQAPFGVAGVNAVVNLNNLATQIKEALQPPKGSEARANWLNVISTILYTASYFEDLPISPEFFGAVGGALGVGALYANGPEGSKQLEAVQVEASKLAVELTGKLQLDSERIETVGRLLNSDYGKLKEVYEDPAFAGFDPAAATDELETSGKQWIYETLPDAAYEAIRLEPGHLNSPLPQKATEYECEGEADNPSGFGGEYKPFRAPANAEYPAPLGVLVERNAKLPSDGLHEQKPISPTASFFEPVYEPLTEENGLGLYQPWFWREAFDFPEGAEIRSVRC